MNIKIFHSKQGVLSYLIYANNFSDAVLIDPSLDMGQEILKFIKNTNLKLEYILETHTHADFFSSRSILKKLYPELKIGLHPNSKSLEKDFSFHDNQKLNFQEFSLQALFTPGHTIDSICYLLKDEFTKEEYLFTGDTLLIGGTGRTDFQQGSSKDMYQSLQRILQFKGSLIIFPGHNYKNRSESNLKEEKTTNQRLKLVLEGKQQEFIDLLDAHKPPKPDLFEESLFWNSL